tara:strand:- start:2553 stop:2738 length:186 start_codon:yes stop_codon:yes gene_type:complete
MNPLDILSGAMAAMQLAQAGTDLYRRMQMGELSPEQAAQEWQRTRDAFNAGHAAWEAAGQQ